MAETNNSSSSIPRVILVLGMHRSGTSVLTRIISLLGADLGKGLIPAVSDDNETGYWEDAEIIALNDQLLTLLQTDWRDPRPLPDSWWEREEFQLWKTIAAEMLVRNFGTSQLFVIKDPRLCRLAPFWISVIDALHYHASFVVMVRDPLEVMASLRKRDSLSAWRSLPDWQANLLWLQHVLDAEHATRNFPRIFVTYDHLLKDWRTVVARISQGLNLHWPVPVAEAVAVIDHFINPQLRHHRHELKHHENGDDYDWTTAAYLEILKSIDQGISDPQQALSRIRDDLTAAEKIFLPWLVESDTKLQESDTKLQESEQRLHVIVQSHRASLAQIDSMRNIIRDPESERGHTLRRIDEFVRQAGQHMRISELEQKIASLGDSNAHLEQRLADTAHLMGMMKNSKSWRFTRPLRELNLYTLRLLELVRWRAHKIILKAIPVDELAQDESKLQFEMRSSRAHAPHGWCELAFNVQSPQGRFTPVLYVDVGDGSGIPHRFLLSAVAHGHSRRLIRLPDRIVAMRLGILYPSCEITINQCRVVELGRLQAAYIIGMPYVRQILVNPKKLIAFIRRGMQIFRSGGMPALKAILSSHQGVPSEYQGWIECYDTLTDADRDAMREQMSDFQRKPLISIIMPVYNTPEQWLRLAIESVRKQIYPHWELCIADDASTFPHVRKLLQKFQGMDARIKVMFRSSNGHISAASNSALGMASGEFIGLLDHDDELSEHALYMVVDEINRFPAADVIYSDEDKLDDLGRRNDPYFKPDWNPDLFKSHNLITHFGVFRTSLAKEIGGFREGYEGSQDWDLATRIIERVPDVHIRHIPHVIYHWRAIPGSMAHGPAEKNYTNKASLKLLNDFIQRHNLDAVAEVSRDVCFRIKYGIPKPSPRVSLIVPTRNGYGLLKVCVESLRKKTSYSNYELIIIDNQSDDARTLDYLENLQRRPDVKVLRYDAPFNYSAINNFGVKNASGEIVGLLNNDLEVISPGWLDEMVSHALRPEIGAVGAMLYYPNNTIQHAGVILGTGGVAGHTYHGQPRGYAGQKGRGYIIQNLSAVTGACLLMRRDVYDEVGGLDENLPVAFNDVDLCMRITGKGYRILWTPYAELYHHESATRGYEDTPEKQARFRKEVEYVQRRWGDRLLFDPAYNPNLALQGGPFIRFSYPPRVTKPWKHLLVND